jgi:hypothetical protein
MKNKKMLKKPLLDSISVELQELSKRFASKQSLSKDDRTYLFIKELIQEEFFPLENNRSGEKRGE